MKVHQILYDLERGILGLPKFQRGFVWDRSKVRRFMYSMYRKYPVGGLLIWNTRVDVNIVRDGILPQGESIDLIVDGQQRITTLYGMYKGRTPPFFVGKRNDILNLYFDLEEEKFEFYRASLMQNNSSWISVTRILQTDRRELLKPFEGTPEYFTYHERVVQLKEILEKVFHVDSITEETAKLEEVVEIFNEVNKGGSSLGEADFTLAKISIGWPTAREEMQSKLNEWSSHPNGYEFTIEWLLRCMNSAVLGRARFNELITTDVNKLQIGLKNVLKYVNAFLAQIEDRLGLDHFKVIKNSRATFPVVMRYLAQNNGAFQSESEIAQLLYWYIHAVLWGRYTRGATESILQTDLTVIDDQKEWKRRFQGLISSLHQTRNPLRIHPDDFIGSTTGNRFYPFLYLLTRTNETRDLLTRLRLNHRLSGNPLELHHIFPKSVLRDKGYNPREVNSLANFAFLTRETNRKLQNREPKDYLAECDVNLVESQWIPTNPKLWKIGNYPKFLSERRKLLSAAANKLLENLESGKLPHS